MTGQNAPLWSSQALARPRQISLWQGRLKCVFSSFDKYRHSENALGACRCQNVATVQPGPLRWPSLQPQERRINKVYGERSEEKKRRWPWDGMDHPYGLPGCGNVQKAGSAVWLVKRSSVKQVSFAPRLVTMCTIVQELPSSSKKCSEWLWQSGYPIDSLCSSVISEDFY